MSEAGKTINNAINSLSQMKESTAVVLIVSITLIIILIAFLYYFYYSGLKKRQCSTMGGIYGDLNGKIQSINDSEQFNYLFRDYYIKTAYNCCSGGSYRNDFVETCHLKYLLNPSLYFFLFLINHYIEYTAHFFLLCESFYKFLCSN